MVDDATDPIHRNRPGDSGEARLIVTIDGPAGTGKSSVARAVADRVGLFVLDTGAMYRGVAWLALQRAIDPSDEDAVVAALDANTIDIDIEHRPVKLLVGGVDPGDALRSAEVEMVVSTIAALPGVRSRLVELQRAIAARHPRLVTEGRDQGSTVFPDATLRFYLTASAGIRADRRVAQRRDHGQDVERQEVLESMEARDRLDRSRKDAPLVKPAGALEIDTDALSLEEVVDRILERIRDLSATP